MPSSSLNPPKQSRSRRTLERIVAASLEILATEGPDGLTVHAVVEKAESSVGSFYARFSGKDDLLDYLGERLWQEALGRWNEALASRDWSTLDLGSLIEGSVGLLVDAQRSRSAYLKALDRMAGRDGDAYATFREKLLEGLSGLLLVRRNEIVHEYPEIAVRLALRSVLGIIDGQARASENRLERDTLIAECRLLMVSYLTGNTKPGRSSAGIEFFDVWG